MIGTHPVTSAHETPRISRIGFGCARLFGGIEARHSARLLERAYAVGIRHFDTAPVYGHGQSEDVLGAVMGGVADVTITTKIGLPRPEGTPSALQSIKRLTLRRVLSHAPALKRRLAGQAPADDPDEVKRARLLSRDAVLREIDESCRRLRRQTVDALLLHEPDQFVLDEDLLASFERLKEQRRIRMHGLAYGRAAPEGAPGWDIVQSGWSGQAEPSSQGRPIRIYHGVMRRPAGGGDGPSRLRDALDAYPQATFLVSASEPHQLTDLARRLA